MKKGVVTWASCKSVTYAPPLSIFDARQGYWQKRKKQWIDAGLHSGVGRDSGLLGNGLKTLADKKGMALNGTSIFDPVLCEIMYNWFCPEKGTVFDPFAGGSVRGVVAELLGRGYIGIDLSERQIDSNRLSGDRFGVCPEWYCDDSRNMDKYMQDETADMVFTCPPYHNLEKYSNHPLDLSNMNYADFLNAYRDIIAKASRKLKQDRFAVFVVGDIRDNKGAYRDFIGETKRAFMENGLFLYNEAVLLEMYGTAPMRAGKIFEAGRKITKAHQNVLIFYKGDMKNIKRIFTNDFRYADLGEGGVNGCKANRQAEKGDNCVIC